MRKFWLHIELFYQIYNMLFAWFGLANYFIVFVILTTSLADPSFGFPGIRYFNLVLKYIYAALIGPSAYFTWRDSGGSRDVQSCASSWLSAIVQQGG